MAPRQSVSPVSTTSSMSDSVSDSGREEPLLAACKPRFTAFPILYQALWDKYKEHEASFWSADEIKLDGDAKDWAKLNDGERRFIKFVLAFFAVSDGFVNKNLVENFIREITILESQYFYGIQSAIENVHANVYSVMLTTFVTDLEELAMLLNAVERVPCIAKKAEWMDRYMEPKNASFATRLVAFAIVEGVFFSGSFASVFWLKNRQLMPGLSKANTYIARDEGLHCEFACLQYRDYVVNKLRDDEVHGLMREAVDIECEFITVAIPVRLIGMNSDDMCQYIKFCADRLLVALGHPKLYNVKNSFDWMARLCVIGYSNFFEKDGLEYRKGTASDASGAISPTVARAAAPLATAAYSAEDF